MFCLILNNDNEDFCSTINLYFPISIYQSPRFSLVVVTLLNYICGLIIDKNDSKKIKKYVVIICVILNITLLGFFKYTNFIIDILELK